MRRNALATLAAAGVLATSMSAPADAGPRPRAVPLTGTVTISARSSAAVRVRVERTLRFDHGIDQDPRAVTGRGRVVGAFLVKPESQDWVGLMRFGHCDRPGCFEPMPRSGPYRGEIGARVLATMRAPRWYRDPKRTEIHVPPGEYDLVVLTDGEPVTVTMRFLGDSRRSNLVAREPRRSHVHAILAPRSPVPAYAGETHLGEDVATTPPYGRIGHGILWMIGEDASVPTHHGWACGYPGGVQASSGDPYGPGCPGVPNAWRVPDHPCTSYRPGGHLGHWVSTPMVGGYFHLMAFCTLAIPAGERFALGMGQHVTGTDAGVVTFWIED